jgi:hypothetical protein
MEKCRECGLTLAYELERAEDQTLCNRCDDDQKRCDLCGDPGFWVDSRILCAVHEDDATEAVR